MQQFLSILLDKGHLLLPCEQNVGVEIKISSLSAGISLIVSVNFPTGIIKGIIKIILKKNVLKLESVLGSVQIGKHCLILQHNSKLR